VSVPANASHWPRHERTCDGVEYRVRPIRKDDAAREREFILSLSPESRFQRFMHAIREPSEDLIAHLIDVDSHSRMALVALIGKPSVERIVGVARYAADADGKDCEFAITVADDWQCRGIGTNLSRLLFEHAAHEGFRNIYGHVLNDNERMIELAESLGLDVEPATPGQSTVRATRCLN
jgi:acetyltransferase